MTASVDCAWLADQLLATSPLNILLLDLRPTEKYVQSHVQGAINLTCSNLLLRRLKKGNLSLSVLVNGDEAKAKFEERSKSQYVVLYDNDSSTGELLNVVLAKLKDESLSQIRVLEGGFCNLSKSHPHVCRAKCQRSRPGSLPHLNLDNLSIGLPLPSPSRRHHDSSKPVRIQSHLFLGCEKDAADLKTLEELRITHILNVTSHVPNKFEDSNRFAYKRISVNDNWTQDISAHFDDAIQFIDDVRAQDGRVLVHCVAGISRSVTVTVAYIMQEFGYCLNDAFDYVKQRKSDVSPNFGFMGQLLEFQTRLDKNKRDPTVYTRGDDAVTRLCPSYVELCAH